MYFRKCCVQGNHFPKEKQKKNGKIYFKISAGNWKWRFYNHRHSFF